MLKEIAQGLLEMKKMARSIENSADAFVPLTDDAETQLRLKTISEMAITITQQINSMYNQVAREALKE